MVLKSQVHTCEFCSHEKKKDLPNPLDIEVTGKDPWRYFQKNENFSFYSPKGTGPDLRASRS